MSLSSSGRRRGRVAATWIAALLSAIVSLVSLSPTAFGGPDEVRVFVGRTFTGQVDDDRLAECVVVGGDGRVLHVGYGDSPRCLELAEKEAG